MKTKSSERGVAFYGKDASNLDDPTRRNLITVMATVIQEWHLRQKTAFVMTLTNTKKCIMMM